MAKSQKKTQKKATKPNPDQLELIAAERDSVERYPLHHFTEKAYLDYSMYVILDRALPHISDGLKPVQRRIVYAMSELGLHASAQYKKSARTVGDVLGKFHPHGDSACYEAMVLMAQDFSYRYPLIDGQGNWGSADDPKSFAAMRYTESRLSPYANHLLKELSQGTVDWVENFDGSLKEPALLPARLPNLLLNGVTGIAVGMSTDILPHNMVEVVNACVHLLKSPKASLEDICQHILGPDLPTGAEIITSSAEIQEVYRKGTGSIKQRAVYRLEEGNIVIEALPYQVSGEKILEQIAALMRAKKLPMLADLRDESDHESPTRLVIVPSSKRVDPEGLMLHLFAVTDLERNYRINLNVIGLDGRPRVFTLLELLQEWLEFRQEVVRKRLTFRLQKVDERLHILAGLLIVFSNLDKVIEIIRFEDHPKQALIKQFKLTETQVNALLEIRLRQLAKLEEQKLRDEEAELLKEKASIELILSSEARLKTQVRKELQADVKTYGDARKSPIVERDQAKTLQATDLIPKEQITIVLSAKGWIRSAKGHQVEGENLSYKSGDAYLAAAQGMSHEPAVFLDQTGRSYSISAHLLPSARGYGEPLSRWFKLAPGIAMSQVMLSVPEAYHLFLTNMGFGFISLCDNLISKNKAGKTFMSVAENARILAPLFLDGFAVDDEDALGSQFIALLSSEGRLLILTLTEIAVMNKGKGNRLIGLGRDETVISACYLNAVEAAPELEVHTRKRTMTLSFEDWQDYIGERGQRGHKLPRGFQSADLLSTVALEVEV